VGFGTCLFFLLLLGGVGVYELKDIADKSDKAIEVDSNIVEYAQRMRSNINMMRRYEKDAYINVANLAKVDEYRKKWGEARDHAKKRMEELGKLEQDPKDKELLAAIGKNLEQYETGFDAVLGKIRSGSITTTQDANVAIGEYKEVIHQAEKNITDYATANDQAMATIKKELDSDVRHAVTLTVSIISVSFIAVLVMVVLLIRSIKRPLNQIEELVNDIAHGEGDLTKRLTYNGNDELGAICASFNLFVEKLRGIIGQIASTSIQVASAASQLNSTAEQIATGAEEVARQSGNVATAGEEMSATSYKYCQKLPACRRGGTERGELGADRYRSGRKNGRRHGADRRESKGVGTDGGKPRCPLRPDRRNYRHYRRYRRSDQPAGLECRYRGSPRR
jgi:methyl-accepting chemotaxis protein